MKKIAILLSLILVACTCFTVAVIAIDAEDANTKTAAELFTEYYNDGEYTRYNEIYLPQNSVDVFHGPVVTSKTTYFTGNTLWMDTNSGYTSSDVGEDVQLNHFKLNEQNQMTDVQSYGNLGDINSFFKTMKTFADDGNENGVWRAIEGGYETRDAETLEIVMAFAASCFTNGKDGNFVTLERAEIKEEGESLVFYLYVIAEDANKLEPVSTLLAKTFVTKGVDSFVINE